MHRTVIGWVIYVGRRCRRAKIFYLQGIEPMSLNLQANTLPRRFKAIFNRKAVDVYYIPRPCDTYITFYYLFELITKIRFSNNSFEFIN